MNTKRKSKVKLEWSHDFAYAIGLITADGNLSPDLRHINFTTKDLDLAHTFRRCLGLSNKIGTKARGGSTVKEYFVVQFGDKNFYDFLLSIGLTKAKSKTLGELIIPTPFFADFLRGCMDGDGSIGVVKHPESSKPQLRTRLYSCSLPFLEWVHSKIKVELSIQGGWIYTEKKSTMGALTFGKADSIRLLEYLYAKSSSMPLLIRKYQLAVPFLQR